MKLSATLVPVCLAAIMAASASIAPVVASTAPTPIPNPILFVTQVPVPADFSTVTSTFGNQSSFPKDAARGGDLWIRYPDGTLKNLTRAAGFGVQGFQGAGSIAVREPSVHWSGTKALFSMVIGAPEQQFQVGSYQWQIYEITGLAENDTPVIRKVANQPADYNNVAPIYGTDDRIIFASDRPRNGAPHLYPQLDEYDAAATVTGLWSLDPNTGDLRMLNHTPSGLFTPSIDSFGRVIFTRWDHLQRDQLADDDTLGVAEYDTFDYADESANAARLNQRVEVFPEPRDVPELLVGTNLTGIRINQFFPWEMNEDGTSEETINHIGRHELQGFFSKSFTDDPALVDFTAAISGRMNQNEIEGMLQIREDPTTPGVYFGIDAPEFETHGSGQIVSLAAPPGKPADQIPVTYVTARSTRDPDGAGAADASGHYRDPLPLSNGTLLAVHTAEMRGDSNDGTPENPKSRYDFRIRTLVQQNGVYVAGAPLTSGIEGSVSYWDPDTKVTWSGTMWELEPVEVRARPRPAPRRSVIEEPEARIFREEGVDPQKFAASLAARNLAVIVSRNVTARDAADRQQPYNLRIAGGTVQHVTGSGKVYDIAHLQLFQADQVRGLGGTASPRVGRRVLARPMHDAGSSNPPTTGPASSVRLGADGSFAAIVPARRAMSWQLTDPAGIPVVRERYWVTFQPGEVRVCAACHGLNTHDQTGQATPQNSPEALRALLQYWKSQQPPVQRRRAVGK